MWVVLAVAESVGLIFGALIGAVLLCMALWRLLALVHHPEWGAPLIWLGAAAMLAFSLTHSPFLRLLMLFAMVGAVPLWIAGREWRAGEKARKPHHRPSLS